MDRVQRLQKNREVLEVTVPAQEFCIFVAVHSTSLRLFIFLENSVDVFELQACLFIFLNENSLIAAVWTASPIVTLHGLERRVCRRRRKAGVAGVYTR
jgi:hypothetical protein